MSRRVRAPLADLEEGERTLDARTSAYLFRVLRLQVGAALEVFDPSARTSAEAEVRVADAGAGVLHIGAVCKSVRAAPAPVLVQALAKGDKLDAIVRDATELGVGAVVLAETARTVVRLDATKAEAKRERLARVAEQAARQSMRDDAPVIHGPFVWADALDAARAHAKGGELAGFCLHPRGVTEVGPPLVEAIGRGAAIAFAVGPEGGLTDEELDEAEARGFTVCAMGEGVLRTETVAAAVLGAVAVMRGRG